MEKTIARVMLGSNFGSNVDQLDTKMISDILSYLYGDKKTIRQIAERVKKHPIQIIYAVECLLKQGIIIGTEESTGNGLERFFTVCEKNQSMEMRTEVNSGAQKVQVASEMGEQIKNVIVSIGKEDCHYISYTVSMLTETDAQKLCEEQQRLESKMSDMETKYETENQKRDRYIMISTIAPYKADWESEM